MIGATSWPGAGGGGIACAGHDFDRSGLMAGRWQVSRLEGRADDLLRRNPFPQAGGRSVWCCRVSRPALVLGSGQDETTIDRARAGGAGLEVVRRTSGGGAVLVVPGQAVWVDVAIPYGDRLWDDDVGRAFWWLGETWARALDSLGVGPAQVHRGPPWRTAWSAQLCFAGLGPGEVTVAGRKVVGLCQRRTRAGAVFFGLVHLRLDAAGLADLLAVDDAGRHQAAADLVRVAAPLGPGVRIGEPATPERSQLTLSQVEAALVDNLPGDGEG